MKSHNGGMLWVDRVGDHGSYVILTQNFSLPWRAITRTPKEASLWAGCRAGALDPTVELSGKDAMNGKGGEVGFVTVGALPLVQARPP